MELSVIITSFKEPETIGKAIQSTIKSIQHAKLEESSEIIVVAPDERTLVAARDAVKEFGGFKNFVLLKDNADGKPAAINLAVQRTHGQILLLTDGDMYIDENAVSLILSHFDSNEIGGVSGHPVSLDPRDTLFGYFSHLHCEAAHVKRLENSESVPMSGYLYAFRNIPDLFPIPEEMRAEDAFITRKIRELEYKIAYEPKAFAYVHFPKNSSDWIKQKTRSLGGNVQLSSIPANLPQKSRTIIEDLKMVLFPLKFAKSLKEFLFSLVLYPIRLYLWVRIYFTHKIQGYSKGTWERIESSKGSSYN